MALYTDKLASESCLPSAEEIETLAMNKAKELFLVCDKEEKGFITRRDMQRLQAELPLSQDQLEAVFDSLDDDGNGFLTLEEFIEGFGSYLGISAPTEDLKGDNSASLYEAEDGDEDVDLQFKQMMHHVGASNLYDDENTLKAMWLRMRKEDQEMATNFEDFLYKISNDIRRSKVDFDTLEQALKSKSLAHDQEVQKLYEEMELQIQQEKHKVLSEEQVKEQQKKEALELELQEKDRQLHELMAKHQEMERQLERLNTIESETKLENEKLVKEKEAMEEQLMQSQQGLEESRAYISQLRDQNKDEKKARARAALKMTEGIALERENLVKQLNQLRDMNKKLQDDRDEAETRRGITGINQLETEELQQILDAEKQQQTKSALSKRREEFTKQGSILGKYFPSSRGPISETQHPLPKDHSLDEDVDDVEVDDDDIEVDDLDGNDSLAYTNTTQSSINSASSPSSSQYYASHVNNNDYYSYNNPAAERSFSTIGDRSLRTEDLEVTRGDESFDVSGKNEDNIDGKEFSPERQREFEDSLADSGAVLTQGPRGQPVGADLESKDKFSEDADSLPPQLQQRIFKVVFVGDSGVGKSSFIHRFCNNTFNPSFSATIGVDFQVKHVPMGDLLIVLQLWDTAGQERFRSITKQYFRKADGVIVMFDVTSENSFLNVRNWIESIKENVEESTVIELIGNKTDLVNFSEKRVVKKSDGRKLAQEHSALFYECSAFSGENVEESMLAMASMLKEKEDEQMEKALHIQESPPKKKFCCG